MQANDPSGQECRGTDLKTTLADDGRSVLVRNARSGSGDVHTVSLDESGTVAGCSCDGWNYNQTCYHVDHVRNSPLLLSSARATAAAGQRVATDGGRVESAESTPDGDESTDDAADTCVQCGREGVEEYVCQACADANDERRESDTSGSETADFGGGEASGMDKLGDFDDGQDDDPETCDHCGEPPELTLTDVSGSEWNDFGQLCTQCVLDVGGPGEAPAGHGSDGDDGGTVDVSPCPGCGAPTDGDTCGRARCEGADEIDEAPL